MSSMAELIEYIAKSVVNDPDKVEVTERKYGRDVTYTLNVAQGDMGRVIGKRGQMANAMRALLRISAVKAGKRVSLEIGD